MTGDEGDVLPLTEVCEPVPTEHTLSTDDDIFSVWLDGFEEGIRVCGQVAVSGDLAMLVEDADVPGPGVEIEEAAMKGEEGEPVDGTHRGRCEIEGKPG